MRMIICVTINRSQTDLLICKTQTVDDERQVKRT